VQNLWDQLIRIPPRSGSDHRGGLGNVAQNLTQLRAETTRFCHCCPLHFIENACAPALTLRHLIEGLDWIPVHELEAILTVELSPKTYAAEPDA